MCDASSKARSGKLLLGDKLKFNFTSGRFGNFDIVVYRTRDFQPPWTRANRGLRARQSREKIMTATRVNTLEVFAKGKKLFRRQVSKRKYFRQQACIFYSDGATERPEYDSYRIFKSGWSQQVGVSFPS